MERHIPMPKLYFEGHTVIYFNAHGSKAVLHLEPGRCFASSGLTFHELHVVVDLQDEKATAFAQKVLQNLQRSDLPLNWEIPLCRCP